MAAAEAFKCLKKVYNYKMRKLSRHRTYSPAHF